MELDSHFIDELSAFFARRGLGPAARARFARDLGLAWREPAPALDDGDAWALLLGVVQTADRLGDLAVMIAREDVHDSNLQQVCSVLAGQRKSNTKVWAAGAGAGAVLAASVGLAIGIWSGPTDVQPRASVVALAPAPALVSTAPAQSAPSRSAAPAHLGGTTPSVAPEARPEAPPAPTAPAAAPHTYDPAQANGRCTTQAGGLVGYWYAGRDSPGAQGQTITMESAVRVRADYPDVHNDFNARASIRCHLTGGDRVRLTQAPIHVPGDAWWVPIHSGDLLQGD